MNRKLHIASIMYTNLENIATRHYQVPARTFSRRRLKRCMEKWCASKGYLMLSLTVSTIR